MPAEEGKATIRDLAGWTIHRPSHSDILSAIRLQRRYRLNLSNAMIVNSELESGCEVLWLEDLKSGQKFGRSAVKNPFV